MSSFRKFRRKVFRWLSGSPKSGSPCDTPATTRPPKTVVEEFGQVSPGIAPGQLPLVKVLSPEIHLSCPEGQIGDEVYLSEGHFSDWFSLYNIPDLTPQQEYKLTEALFETNGEIREFWEEKIHGGLDQDSPEYLSASLGISVSQASFFKNALTLTRERLESLVTAELITQLECVFCSDPVNLKCPTPTPVTLTLPLEGFAGPIEVGVLVDKVDVQLEPCAFSSEVSKDDANLRAVNEANRLHVCQYCNEDFEIVCFSDDPKITAYNSLVIQEKTVCANTVAELHQGLLDLVIPDDFCFYCVGGDDADCEECPEVPGERLVFPIFCPETDTDLPPEGSILDCLEDPKRDLRDEEEDDELEDYKANCFSNLEDAKCFLETQESIDFDEICQYSNVEISCSCGYDEYGPGVTHPPEDDINFYPPANTPPSNAPSKLFTLRTTGRWRISVPMGSFFYDFDNYLQGDEDAKQLCETLLGCIWVNDPVNLLCEEDDTLFTVPSIVNKGGDLTVTAITPALGGSTVSVVNTQGQSRNIFIPPSHDLADLSVGDTIGVGDSIGVSNGTNENIITLKEGPVNWGQFQSYMDKADANERAIIESRNRRVCAWFNDEVFRQCDEPLLGSVTVYEGTFLSLISQADADARAEEAADSALVCVGDDGGGGDPPPPGPLPPGSGGHGVYAIGEHNWELYTEGIPHVTLLSWINGLVQTNGFSRVVLRNSYDVKAQGDDKPELTADGAVNVFEKLYLIETPDGGPSTVRNTLPEVWEQGQITREYIYMFRSMSSRYSPLTEEELEEGESEDAANQIRVKVLPSNTVPSAGPVGDPSVAGLPRNSIVITGNDKRGQVQVIDETIEVDAEVIVDWRDGLVTTEADKNRAKQDPVEIVVLNHPEGTGEKVLSNEEFLEYKFRNIKKKSGTPITVETEGADIVIGITTDYPPPPYSSSGSDKSTAIVPAKWSPTGYTALFTEESPEVLFHDNMRLAVKPGENTFRIDYRYLAACEKGEVWVSAIVGNYPGTIGAEVVDKSVIVRLGEDNKSTKVALTLTGVRRGFLGMRFPTRTREQFEANEAFINSAYPRS